jgi:hypothetical protein
VTSPVCQTGGKAAWWSHTGQRVAAEIDPQMQPLDFKALFLIPERVLPRTSFLLDD